MMEKSRILAGLSDQPLSEGNGPSKQDESGAESTLSGSVAKFFILARSSFERLSSLGLDFQHVAVLGAVMKASLRRLPGATEDQSFGLPDRIPDYAFQPVAAQRLKFEVPVSMSTLRRRLEELVELGALDRTEDGYLPSLTSRSATIYEAIGLALETGRPTV